MPEALPRQFELISRGRASHAVHRSTGIDLAPNARRYVVVTDGLAWPFYLLAIGALQVLASLAIILVVQVVEPRMTEHLYVTLAVPLIATAAGCSYVSRHGRIAYVTDEVTFLLKAYSLKLCDASSIMCYPSTLLEHASRWTDSWRLCIDGKTWLLRGQTQVHPIGRK
jgi:hypothetical protein